MHTLSQTNTSFRGSRSIGTASRSSTECKDAARSTCHISFCEWSHEISRDVAGEVWEFGPMFPVAHCWILLCLYHPLSSSINLVFTKLTSMSLVCEFSSWNLVLPDTPKSKNTAPKTACCLPFFPQRNPIFWESTDPIFAVRLLDSVRFSGVFQG